MNEQLVSKASRIASLIVKRVQEKLTIGENDELEAWLAEDYKNTQLFEELTDNSRLTAAMDEMNTYDNEVAYERLSGKLFQHARTPELKSNPPRLWRYIAAAALTILAGSIVLFIVFRKKTSSAAPVVNQQQTLDSQPVINKSVSIIP